MEFRRKHAQKFVRVIFDCISKDFGERAGPNCQFSTYGFLMSMLKHASIVPGMSFDDNPCILALVIRINAIIDALVHFDSKSILFTVHEQRNRNPSKETCNYCSRDFAADLREVIGDFLRQIPGLCLACLKEGNRCLGKFESCQHRGETAHSMELTSDSDSDDEASSPEV